VERRIQVKIVKNLRDGHSEKMGELRLKSLGRGADLFYQTASKIWFHYFASSILVT
jgi:hypothetical protein